MMLTPEQADVVARIHATRGRTGRPHPDAADRARQAAQFLHDEGGTFADAAGKFEVHETTVARVYRLMFPNDRIKGSGPKMNPNSTGRQAARFAHDEVKSLSVAAARFGITEQAVRWAWRDLYPDEPIAGRVKSGRPRKVR
jgi:hypothetical protein